MNLVIVGIDIGGSHLTSAIIDPQAGSIVRESLNRGDVDSQGSADEVIDEWAKTIRQTLEGRAEASVRIGIAMPGPFNFKEGISLIQNQSKYDALYGLNVKEMLARGLEIPVKDIQFSNDAECFLRGEMMYGAGKGYDYVMGLTLGTGLGTAWHRDGKTSDADLWRLPYRDGIAEDYCSTRWFVQRYKEVTNRTVGEAREVAELARKGDSDAQKLFNEFGENLASFLLTAAGDEKPEAVVVGGNISRAFDLFYPALENALSSEGADIAIRPAKLGEEAALIGAASVWITKVYEDA